MIQVKLASGLMVEVNVAVQNGAAWQDRLGPVPAVNTLRVEEEVAQALREAPELVERADIVR